MSTAFQSNAFQSDAFQIHGGVTSGAITGSMDYTNEDDTFSGTANLGEGLLNPKLIARWPNVRVRGFGGKKKEQPVVVIPEPAAPYITNMPGAPKPKAGSGLNLGLIKAAPPVTPQPLPAITTPEVTLKPLLEKPPLKLVEIAVPAEAPVSSPPAVVLASVPLTNPPPLPPSEVEVNTTRVLDGVLKDNQAQTERLLMALDSLTMRVQELHAEIAEDRKARDLREQNLLRAKRIADKLLMDLGN